MRLLLLQDLLLGMNLAVVSGHPWVLMNGALAAWNVYVPIMQKQRYAELAGVLLPLLKQLLQVRVHRYQHHCCSCSVSVELWSWTIESNPTGPAA